MPLVYRLISAGESSCRVSWAPLQLRGNLCGKTLLHSQGAFGCFVLLVLIISAPPYLLSQRLYDKYFDGYPKKGSESSRLWKRARLRRTRVTGNKSQSEDGRLVKSVIRVSVPSVGVYEGQPDSVIHTCLGLSVCIFAGLHKITGPIFAELFGGS